VDPKLSTKLADLERRLLDRPGSLDPSVRRAAAFGTTVPEQVVEYVDKVRRHAYEVTDDEVEALRASGWAEDQLFELTLAAAYGAARRRLDAGLDAMGPVAKLPAGGDGAP
jgi:alkylhydroperoxidase family enzyme